MTLPPRKFPHGQRQLEVQELSELPIVTTKKETLSQTCAGSNTKNEKNHRRKGTAVKKRGRPREHRTMFFESGEAVDLSTSPF